MRKTLLLALGLILAKTIAFAATSPVNFAQPDIIRYDHDCFTINGHDTYVYSGEFHYFRCPKPLWKDRLIKLKQAGYNCIDIYVPWNWHEQVQSKPDFTDLVDILKLAQNLGLYVIARPGPYICAEWDAGGFPVWLSPKQVGFRSDNPESIKWSKYWYDEVMPVIARHQITKGGPVIMVQLENEYNYCGKPGPEMANYVKALYKAAKENGIEVPFITCWTWVVRDSSDPVMQQIMDTCNFYCGWGIDGMVQGNLPALEKEEQYSPRMVTELQGGWFRFYGQPDPAAGLEAKQINALTKTCIAFGTTATNHYMAFGGTNFGWWAARNITTSYDYNAPIKEPGGLWDKYYATKLVGNFCETFKELIARAHLASTQPSSDQDSVTTQQRNNGDTAFVFVRNQSGDPKRAVVKATNPKTGSPLYIKTHLSPLDMKIFPINLKVGDATILWANADVQSITKLGSKTLVVLYTDKIDDTDSIEAEIESSGKVSRISLPLGSSDSSKTIGSLQIVATTRERAERTWKSFGGITTSCAYLIDPRGKASAEVYTKPGKCEVRTYVAKEPKQVTVNGKKAAYTYDAKAGSVAFTIDTPQIPAKAFELKNCRLAYDNFSEGTWRDVKLQSLDKYGIFQHGFIRYRTSFEADGPSTFTLNSYSPSPVLLFANGKLAGKLESVASMVTAGQAGKNTVEAIYGSTARANGGGGMEELKGISNVNVVPAGSIQRIDFPKFKFAKTDFKGDTDPLAQPDADESAFQTIDVGSGQQNEMTNYVAWAWYRTEFSLPQDAEAGTLVCEGIDDNCRVYINGKKIGENYGWDIPAIFDASSALKPGRNVLAIAVQNTAGIGGIYKPVYLMFGKGKKTILDNWQIAENFAGENAGYQQPNFNDSTWKTVQLDPKSEPKESKDMPLDQSVAWYRMSFNLPKNPDWQIPWKLHLDGNGEALIYLNGHLIGIFEEYDVVNDFYLPECWLKFGKEQNTLSLAVRATTNQPEIKSARIEPYPDYSVKINQVVVK